MLAILLYVGLYVPCAVICTSILFSPDAPFIGGIIIIIIMLVVVVASRVYNLTHTIKVHIIITYIRPLLA